MTSFLPGRCHDDDLLRNEDNRVDGGTNTECGFSTCVWRSPLLSIPRGKQQTNYVTICTTISSKNSLKSVNVK